jgi:gluconolactonase
MEWEFKPAAGPFNFTEGPVWDGKVLLFTDIATSRVLRYDPATGASDVFWEGTNEGNGLALDAQGRVYACEGGGRRVATTSQTERPPCSRTGSTVDG